MKTTTTMKRMVAVGVSALALTTIVGCSSTTDTTVPTVTESQAQEEVTSLGNHNGGYNNVGTEKASYSNGVVDVAVDGKKHIVSLDDAKKIFSATVDGTTYSFPCDVKELLDAGWEYSESNNFRVSKMEQDRKFKYTFGENHVVFKQGATDDYGVAENEIFANIANAYHEEPTYWEDCTLLGLGFDASAEDMASNLDGMADFETGIGINVGDSIQDVMDLFGCWKYYDDSTDKESDLFAIYVEGNDDAVGYVNFYQTDGVITYVNIKVNVNMVDVLK